MATPNAAENKNPGQPVAGGSAAPVADLVPSEPQFIQLPAGTVLTEGQALALAADRSMRTIVLAGAVDCGKTTLLSSVYELFQSGPLGPIQFAGCETFPAFEQRCHLSRTESENDKPDSSRTPYDGPNPEYLHLRIQPKAGDVDQIDFLFTDVSGEMFEHARNSIDDCKELKFLRRASHFVVFLDCEKALITDKKWTIVQEVKTLFQSCLDSFMLPKDCCVTVVWSKCDFFAAAKDKVTVNEFVKLVEDDLKTSFGDRIPQLKFRNTAARPTRYPNLKMGYGVRELLADWISMWPQGRSMRLAPPAGSISKKEIDQFAVRHFGGGEKV
jgi:hypothetical protein